jgi:hypothetical protein
MRLSEQKKLLEETFREGEFVEASKSAFHAAAAEFRRTHPRRWSERILPLAAALALLAAGLAILWRPAIQTAPRIAVSDAPVTPAIHLVRTVPLKPSQLVRTEAFKQRDENGGLQSLGIIVTSKMNENLVVATSAEPRVPLLTDADLLAAFPHQPVLLATIGPGQKRFVLIDAATQHDSPSESRLPEAH